jgi:hypothetical protein
METERYVHPVHHVYDGLITSYSGVKIDLNSPFPHMFNNKDIAQGLSNICRFGGQMGGFYSVAQHSVLVMLLAPKRLALPALIHDAPEAYLGDVVKPLKVMLGDVYGKIEAAFQQAICLKYHVDESDLLEIKQFDRRALELEYAYIHGRNTDLESEFEKLPIAAPFGPVFWEPQTAAEIWLKYVEMFI